MNIKIILLAAGILSILCIIIYLKNVRYYNGPISKKFDGTIFRNSADVRKKSFVEFLKWQGTALKGFWPDKIINQNFDVPPDRIYDGDILRVSFVGHSTVLLQIAGLNILTDPVWSERASPLSFVGPKRVMQPGIKFDDLPKIDIILVSHNHYDHMDLPTLKKIANRDNARIIVPLGNDTIIRNYDASIKVEAHDWDDVVIINDKVKIHIEEAQHWSSRTIFDNNKALWCAFTIETIYGNIYFAGDTGYSPHFIRTQQKHQKFLLALLPIGAFEPRWFMEPVHTSPQEAVAAFKELKADYALAIHYATFCLADDGFTKPFDEIKRLLHEQNIDNEHFRLVPVGLYWNISTGK
jgi:L-ascorbate metabolism protein UlaG (beta-lactamase superfamily)